MFSMYTMYNIGISKYLFEQILTSRKLEMSIAKGSRGSSYHIPLDINQSIYARDAISKSLYKVCIALYISPINIIMYI
jgi:myosin heavy subunit